MTKSSMILKMATLAVAFAAGGLLASTPAGAYTAVNGLPINGIALNGVELNALYPKGSASNPDALTGDGASSAAGHASRVGRGASGVDVNRLRLRAIVLPGEPGRPTAG